MKTNIRFDRISLKSSWNEKNTNIFIVILKAHNSISIYIFQKIVILMKWCTILSYYQNVHKWLYDPCTILVFQRKVVITHSVHVICIYLFSTALMVARTCLIIKRVAYKSLARLTSTNIPPNMIISPIYKHQNLLSL